MTVGGGAPRPQQRTDRGGREAAMAFRITVEGRKRRASRQRVIESLRDIPPEPLLCLCSLGCPSASLVFTF